MESFPNKCLRDVEWSSKMNFGCKTEHNGNYIVPGGGEEISVAFSSSVLRQFPLQIEHCYYTAIVAVTAEYVSCWYSISAKFRSSFVHLWWTYSRLYCSILHDRTGTVEPLVLVFLFEVSQFLLKKDELYCTVRLLHLQVLFDCSSRLRKEIKHCL